MDCWIKKLGATSIIAMCFVGLAYAAAPAPAPASAYTTMTKPAAAQPEKMTAAATVPSQAPAPVVHSVAHTAAMQTNTAKSGVWECRSYDNGGHMWLSTDADRVQALSGAMRLCKQYARDQYSCHPGRISCSYMPVNATQYRCKAFDARGVMWDRVSGNHALAHDNALKACREFSHFGHCHSNFQACTVVK